MKKNEPRTYPKIPLFNPDDDDFETTFDFDEDGKGEPWVIHSGEIEEYPEPVAKHIKKHLAEHLLFKWGWQNSNADDKREKIIKQIEVHYD